MLYLRVKKDFLNKIQTLESLLNFTEIFESTIFKGILHNDVLNTLHCIWYSFSGTSNGSNEFEKKIHSLYLEQEYLRSNYFDTVKRLTVNFIP